MSKIPTPEDVKRLHGLNVALTQMGKRLLTHMPTQAIEAVMHNAGAFIKPMKNLDDDGNPMTLEIPVATLQQICTFANISLSRLLWERYKWERQVGRPYAPEGVTVDITEGDVPAEIESKESELTNEPEEV